MILRRFRDPGMTWALVRSRHTLAGTQWIRALVQISDLGLKHVSRLEAARRHRKLQRKAGSPAPSLFWKNKARRAVKRTGPFRVAGGAARGWPERGSSDRLFAQNE